MKITLVSTNGKKRCTANSLHLLLSKYQVHVVKVHQKGNLVWIYL
jgi:hypothetical protein